MATATTPEAMPDPRNGVDTPKLLTTSHRTHEEG